MSRHPLRHTAFRNTLLDWYVKYQRPLPWRKTKDPYAIWLSEIMLQQTTVETVIPYYKRFLLSFPTIESVAASRPERLLKAWAGLGYYRRIRNFHRAAKMVKKQYGGLIPRRYEDLIHLPGVGTYTAAAIASIAFGEPVAVVDGNVSRVISRLFCLKDDISTNRSKEKVRELAQTLLDSNKAGDFNQGLMELGATVCLPSRPQCPQCPVKRLCLAYAKGVTSDYPVKLKKAEYRREEYFCLLFSSGGRILLRQRSSSEILSGMWEFPLFPILTKSQSREEAVVHELRRYPWAIRKEAHFLPIVRHTIMNRRMTIYPCLVELKEKNLPSKNNPYRWVSRQQLKSLPLTTVTRKVFYPRGDFTYPHLD